MSEVNNTFLLNELQFQFADSIYSADEPYGLLTIELDPKQIIPVLNFLKVHPIIHMNFLTDLCGIHYPENKGKELGVIYHLHSFTENIRLRIKCFMPNDEPKIDTITSIYGAANWQERETWDFYGIEFIGHPNLTRILNVDEMDYHPLRKEYPLEDQTRTDKNDNYFGR
ncbi:MAG: NADH-quinone oxidoreductase subunit C [Bacteroidia bacterium]|nr:NADH-quinone oxidoreductase subunit C [Bacteroidia bacterium]MCF8427745.1 NADH-quinone oxidoreductase subunit C [Bacteroidia bacterium]MCF8446385.1 NADH-quinone oxidoreductase subunit C [Bacteroidia bacterium]